MRAADLKRLVREKEADIKLNPDGAVGFSRGGGQVPSFSKMGQRKSSIGTQSCRPETFFPCHHQKAVGSSSAGGNSGNRTRPAKGIRGNVTLA